MQALPGVECRKGKSVWGWRCYGEHPLRGVGSCHKSPRDLSSSYELPDKQQGQRRAIENAETADRRASVACLHCDELQYIDFELGLLLPSTTQPLVELHQRQLFVKSSLYQSQLGREIIRVIGEDLQITRNATAVAHVR